MIDPNKISAPLARKLIELALLAEREGYAIGSTSEQIVAALISGRADWLPSNYPEPLGAIKRLHAGVPIGGIPCCTCTAWTGVSSRGTRQQRPMRTIPRSVGDKSPIIGKTEVEEHRMGRVYARVRRSAPFGLVAAG